MSFMMDGANHGLNNINVLRQYVEHSTECVSQIHVCENNDFNGVSNADTGFYYCSEHINRNPAT